MKFLPTINLCNPAIACAVRLGQIRLQAGQWLNTCEGAGLSRFVSLRRSGDVWAVHATPGKRGPSQGKFSRAVKLWNPVK